MLKTCQVPLDETDNLLRPQHLFASKQAMYCCLDGRMELTHAQGVSCVSAADGEAAMTSYGARLC